MSFLSKLADKLDDLNIGGSSEKPKDREGGYPSQQSYPPPSQQYEGGGYSQQSYPPQYGGSPAPPQSGGGYPDRQQGYYSSPPPQPSGPTYAPPSDKPPIPAGWIPQFDQQYQRWYYYEEATGRSQWEAPGYHAGSLGEDRGYGSHGESSHGAPAPGYGYSSHDSHGYGGHGESGYGHSGESHGEYRGEEKKKKDHSGLMMGAVGGLAVGAIGGALLADALDDSDEERHQAPAPVYAAPAPAYAEPVYEPAYNAEGEYVDASDRESVASAREEYQEELADSSASSSDVEEAREEYEDEYEEAYDD
ncbi:hypothetical protein F4821DRAFT_78672 [Hypoxylon rubiginosum]|uniref:Uncharacterized protein n=1 Tax=Hypoxylon rubiginosum TaxID=110542 RepID=A0ACC0DLN7_9PEZI|nr:hypothetical protein F4821DRAFT_78672 [Hypoxylon rubiginosum]